jgi:hypothetical protein
LTEVGADTGPVTLPLSGVGNGGGVEKTVGAGEVVIIGAAKGAATGVPVGTVLFCPNAGEPVKSNTSTTSNREDTIVNQLYLNIILIGSQFVICEV